jgi:hypothetical protein
MTARTGATGEVKAVVSGEEEPTSDRPLSDRLRELGEAIGAAKVHERDLVVKQQQLAQEISDLGEQIIELHAQGDTASASKISKSRARAEGVVARDLSAQLEGSRRVVQRAEVERSTYCMENIDGVVARAQTGRGGSGAGGAGCGRGARRGGKAVERGAGRPADDSPIGGSLK